MNYIKSSFTITEDVLDVIRSQPNVCSNLHLPVQSGSSSVLARMRRGYTREVAHFREIFIDINANCFNTLLSYSAVLVVVGVFEFSTNCTRQDPWCDYIN